MVVLQAYVDDTNKGNEPVFALGGLVASVDSWLRFSDAWDAKLREPPGIEYFKAREAAGLQGQFRDWDIEARDRKVAALIEPINQYAITYIGCAVIKHDWEEVFRGQMSKTMDSPVFFAYMRIITNLINNMYFRADLAGIAEFIFDTENQTMYREILHFWLAAKQEYPRRFRKRMGNDPITRDDRKVVALQAADMVAWTFGKMSDVATPSPSMALDIAKQMTISGIPELWAKHDLAVFFSQAEARGKWGAYETGKARSARLSELFGPRGN